VHQFSPLLNSRSRRWLDRYQWEVAPRVEGQAHLRLPAWTNREPDWRNEVRPTIELTGSFEVGPASFRTIPVLSARSHFGLSNDLWRLPDLIVERPEGRLGLQITHNSVTEQYMIGVAGIVMPKDIGPLLGEKGVEVLDLFEFRSPARFEGFVGGPWSTGTKQTIGGAIGLTNFSFRGEQFDTLKAEVLYTNRYLAVASAELTRGTGRVDSPGVGYDFDTQELSITNTRSTIEPDVVARAISPKFAPKLSSYRFGKPPTILANGKILTRDVPVGNMEFQVQGGPFSWWEFNLAQIDGRVLWRNNLLILTNMSGPFYGGKISGRAQFDLGASNGAPFNFTTRVSEVDLGAMMRDIKSGTNKLEGSLSGELNVVSANTGDWQSWNGLGHATLRDGLIWEIPMFGLVSPVLNAFWPGLGSSRAEQGEGTFVITNSVINTKDLEIKASMMRLHYDGTVDFSGQVNARAEAELMRDTWLLGPFISLAFTPLTKLFEFKVTGSLNHPKKEPLYIPKILLMPLHPIKTLKEVFSNPNPGAPTGGGPGPP
jgi:hypothetical protein